MFRKLFAAFVAALAVMVSVAVNAAEYKVKKDDCLWGIARRAGRKGQEYSRVAWMAANEKRFAGKSVHLIYTGEILEVPDAWAVALGIVPAPAVVKSAPVVPVVEVMEPIPVPETVWPGLVGLILGLTAFAVMAMGLAKFRPWIWFRPERVGEPVAEGGVRNPEHAAELLRSQAQTQAKTQESPLKALRRVRIFGVIEVAGADGEFKTRVCAGDEAWEGRFADGSALYVLDACANPLRLGKGGRLLSGHVVQLEDVPVPAPAPSATRRAAPRVEPRSEPFVEVPPAPAPSPQLAPRPEQVTVPVLQQVWNLTPTVLKQGPKGKLILEPVWRVPDPA